MYDTYNIIMHLMQHHDWHLRRFRCVGGGGTAGGRCWTRCRRPGQHHRGRGNDGAQFKAVDVVVFASDQVSHVVPVMSKNVSDSILYKTTLLSGLDFPRFSRRKARLHGRHCDENDDRDDWRTDILCRVPAKRADCRQRRPLSRRRSTTCGGVAHRCYDDPRTSQRRVGKMWFRFGGRK